MKPLHEKYEPYNFKIISVALEKNKKRWLKALNEENLPWVTLWAKRYPEDQISKDYNVHSLPHYVLIDKDNSILYPGVSLPQIQQVLKKIFIEDSLDVYRTYSPFKKDSISITIERGSTKKEIKSIKQYLNKYGIEAVLTGKYDKHGKLESLSGTLKYKRQNGNVTFSSSNRMKKVIIKIESVGENPSISIFTEAKSLFNWK